MYDLVGSMYIGKSDKFQTGMSVDRNVSKTLLTGGECAIVCKESLNMSDINPSSLGNVYDDKFGQSFGGNVWDKEKVAPTLKSSGSKGQDCVIESIQMLGQMDNSDGSHEIANRVYDSDGLSPCLNAHAGDTTPKIISDTAKLIIAGKMDNSQDHTFDSCNMVYDSQGIAPTLTSGRGGGVDPKIVAMRGRDVENPTQRQRQNPNNPFQQRLEAQPDGLCGTLTTFQKDNMVLENVPISTNGERKDVANTILAGYERTNMTGFNNDNAVLVGGIGEMKSNNGTQYYQQDRVYDSNGIAMAHPSQMESYKYMVEEKTHQQDNVQSENGISRTLVAGSHGNADTYTKTIVDYQIRKLTPKECFRLMGVKDEDYEKLTVSNSQKYKQAGNSIVVDVLMSIFDNMFVQECKSNALF